MFNNFIGTWCLVNLYNWYFHIQKPEGFVYQFSDFDPLCVTNTGLMFDIQQWETLLPSYIDRNMKNVKQLNEENKGIIHTIQTTTNHNDRNKTTTTSEVQAPDLG